MTPGIKLVTLLRRRYGPELIANGTFDTSTTGWAGSMLSVVGGQLKVDGTAGTVYADQAIETIVGKTYRFSVNSTYVSGAINVRVGTSENSVDVYTSDWLTASINQTISFVAASTTSHIALSTGSTGFSYFDNISVRRHL